MKDETVLKVTGIVCITAMAITYFVTVAQDGSVLLTLSSIIGGLVGYQIGKKRS